MKIQDYINKGELIISDKILEQRYEYDVDKTAAEVKEILNGDDSDQSYELIEIVGKRVSRDLVKNIVLNCLNTCMFKKKIKFIYST